MVCCPFQILIEQVIVDEEKFDHFQNGDSKKNHGDNEEEVAALEGRGFIS